ncbi:phenylalanine--tRNA ligase subunit beta [Alphaproteobacteria bacterium LSUCC0719]
MKFTRDWLFDHLETDRSLAEILDALPMLGLEVESFDDPTRRLAPFTIAEVISAEQHPDADRLRVCMVNTGSGDPVQVVCGAPNARAGMKGVFAPVGAWVPGIELELKAGSIRGQDSNGMLCSEREMMISDEHDGIIELAADAPLGESFAAFAGLDDPVIEIAITPNRADCLGVRGVARDLAAAGYGTLKPLDTSPHEGGFDSPVTWRLDLEGAEHLCPLITGIAFRGVSNRPSPDWMARRLTAIGQRPISALVDITNYVMFDLGRPLHAYDTAKIEGGELIVRQAQGGEPFAALNEKTYEMQPGMITIGDAGGVDDLAGVMGGERTGVSDTTTDMFLEIAIFDPISVATTGRKLNLNSDARYRFERGLDSEGPIWAAGHVARMVTEICGGEASVPVTAGAGVAWQRTIFLASGKVEALSGMVVAADEQQRILESLGFTVSAVEGGFDVAPPPWRGDIDGSADLVEEIARIRGFDHLPMEHLPRDEVVAKPSLSPAQARLFRLRRTLAGRGLMEAVTFSFLSEADAVRFGGGSAALTLVNPISADLSVMRPSILPNLLAAAARNQDRGESDAAMFEVGPVFLGDAPGDQRTATTGLRHGSTAPREWHGAMRQVDVFDARADAEAALAALGIKLAGVQVHGPKQLDAIPDWYHPGRVGRLVQGHTVLASFGEIHPSVAETYGLRGRAVGFEIHVDDVPMPKSKGPARQLLSLSVYQPVTRDFAFIIDSDVTAGDLMKAVKSGAGPLLTDLRVFDLYEGANIGEGRKSIAVTITLTPTKATLTEAEIDAISSEIVKIVGKNCGGELRR